MSINLLPKEKKPKGVVIKASKSLKKIVLVAIVVFLVAGSTVIGGLIFFSRRTEKAVSEKESIKTEIKNLSASEQKLVLLKDRIAKIQTIENLPNAKDEVDVLDLIRNDYTQGMYIKTVVLDTDVANVVIVSPDLAQMSRFLASVVSGSRFAKIKMLTFEFNTEEGYVAELDFIR